MSALNRFRLQEEVFASTRRSSPSSRAVAWTRSENKVARSCRSSRTSLSFCWISAVETGEEEEEQRDIRTQLHSGSEVTGSSIGTSEAAL